MALLRGAFGFTQAEVYEMTWDQVDLYVHEAMRIEERVAARAGVKTAELFAEVMVKLFGG